MFAGITPPNFIHVLRAKIIKFLYSAHFYAEKFHIFLFFFILGTSSPFFCPTKGVIYAYFVTPTVRSARAEDRRDGSKRAPQRTKSNFRLYKYTNNIVSRNTFTEKKSSVWAKINPTIQARACPTSNRGAGSCFSQSGAVGCIGRPTTAIRISSSRTTYRSDSRSDRPYSPDRSSGTCLSISYRRQYTVSRHGRHPISTY